MGGWIDIYNNYYNYKNHITTRDNYFSKEYAGDDVMWLWFLTSGLK